jgi:lysophospholipase
MDDANTFDISPGSLNHDIVEQLATSVGGLYETHLQWFARTCVFSEFPGHDGHILQAYHFPTTNNDSKPAFVFLAGWTETSLKFGNVFKSLFDAGHSIYSFDLRGQGFSAPISYDRGPVSHMTDFGDYVKDLEHYIASTIGGDKDIIFMGLSLGTIVGLHAAKRVRFKQMILVAPALRIAMMDWWVMPVFNAAVRLGLGSFLLTRFDNSITYLNCTHHHQFRFDFLRMRRLVPLLQVQGPTVVWGREFMKASADIIGEDLGQTILIVKCGKDDIVDNTAINEFCAVQTSGRVEILDIPNAYHEAFQETDDIVSTVVEAVLRFVNLYR